MNWRTLFRRFLSAKRPTRIDPDEVLLDAANLPALDENQFEGRIEQPLSKQTFLYFATATAIVLLAFTGRLFLLQVVEGGAYAVESENNRLEHSLIFADRGIIYDRNNLKLVWNTIHETEPFSKRVYADEDGLAHMVGYIGYPLKDAWGNYYQEEFEGRSGVERSFNEELQGENGLKIVETDALGNIRSESITRPSQNGRDVLLTVDARVSAELYRLIEGRARESGFLGGAGVIMDVTTGEVISLVSFPEYDSDALVEGGAKLLKRYLSDERKPFLNRVVSGLYTPGSVVKLFLAVGALEEGIITPETEILSTGVLTIPNPYFPDKVNVFRDWKAHGLVDLRQAIAVSSNVYFYEVGGGYGDQAGLGIESIEQYMRLFGFGKETGIALPGEALGTIPNPAWKEATFEDGLWRIGDTYHTAIGQYGFQVTPLQAVRAVASIGNGGLLLAPVLELDESSAGEVVPVASENLRVVREGMRLAVTEGTASGLLMSNVAIAAKTGTAELGVSKDLVNSWVVGFFPYENPRYAFAVLMERGPRENTVGALSVMRRLFEWMSINTPEYL